MAPLLYKSQRKSTLRQRLTASFLVVGLASLVIAGVVYAALDVWQLREQYQDRLELIGDLVARSASTSQREIAPLFAEEPAITQVEFLNADLESVDSWARTPAQTTAPFELIVERPVLTSGEVESVLIRGTVPGLPERLLKHLAVLGTLSGLSILTTLGLSRRIHARYSDQILDLVHAANAVTARKDYSIRAIPRGDEEIRILVDTFNHMLTQMEVHDSELREQIDRAEQARMAKAQFLATMSHEIRTPINGVIGMSALLLDTDLDREQTDFARTVHHSAESLLRIVNDILDFTKAEAGKLQLENIEFDLHEVVGNSLDTVSSAASEKGIELCCELQQAPRFLRGDPTRLRQVLLNLLGNAVKFTESGEVVVTVAEEDDGKLRFQVTDTGIGIPKDRIDRLFESFTQVDAANSRKYGGSGLGLAISKQIVEAMGGTMFVKTREGVGSSFGFRVELDVGEAEPDTETPAAKGLRVLVADPNDTSREILTNLLKGAHVTSCTTGAEASGQLRQAAEGGEDFDVVMADLRLVGEISRPSEADPPMLVVMAPVSEVAAASDIEWPTSIASLAKPVRADHLSWCIEGLLRSSVSPAEETPKKRGTTEKLTRPDGDVYRLLVAEDHAVNQKITTCFLDKLGIEWLLVENGQEAVEAVKLGEFDLVLMDIQMPVMDGLEATRIIREMEFALELPIVALTANVLEEDRNTYLANGFDGHLPKPLNLDQLRGCLEKHLSCEEAVPG